MADEGAVHSPARKNATGAWPPATLTALALDAWLANVLERFADRVLPLGPDEALVWGERTAGHPQPVIDGLLAATAARHRLAVVTRNGRDFPGVEVIDPFSA